MKKLRYIWIVGFTALALLSGCKKKDDGSIDLSTRLTTAAATETLAQATKPSEPGIPLNMEPTETAPLETDAASSMASTPTRTERYRDGLIDIEYPAIYDTDDNSKESAVNQLIKGNATAIVAALGLDGTKDTLDIDSQVITADRKRVAILYTGTHTAADAPYPTNIFYSNTIDLNKANNLRLNDFADPYTMAGYVLSGDCRFEGAAAKLVPELMAMKNGTTLEAYTEMFTKADFPVGEMFPQSFSYEQQGNIYFSIPVPHALGDYAIVKFAPEAK